MPYYVLKGVEKMRRVEYVVLCIGAGGTGGNFIKEFSRFCAFFKSKEKTIKIVLIDGDNIEEKNQERQPFLSEDVMQNKAVTLVSAIQDTFLLDNIDAYTDYINNAKQLHDIYNKIALFSKEDEAEGMYKGLLLSGSFNGYCTECI